MVKAWQFAIINNKFTGSLYLLKKFKRSVKANECIACSCFPALMMLKQKKINEDLVNKMFKIIK